MSRDFHTFAQILYSLATQRYSRETLFNIVIGVFMVWFLTFALLYPSHETIHFHSFAEDTLKTLPSGLAGAVGMVSPDPLLRLLFLSFRCLSEGRLVSFNDMLRRQAAAETAIAD